MTKNGDSFWSWFLHSGMKIRVPSPRSPILEFIAGTVIVVNGSAVVNLYLSPFWIFLTVPVGVTLAAHGWWRRYK